MEFPDLLLSLLHLRQAQVDRREDIVLVAVPTRDQDQAMVPAVAHPLVPRLVTVMIAATELHQVKKSPI